MSALQEFKPSALTPWDKTRAAHLLNRAGFGGLPEEIDAAVKRGFPAAVDYLVDFDKIPYEYAPPPLPDPIEPGELRGIKDLPQAQRQEKIKDLMKENREAVEATRNWWIHRMLNSPRPLEEKLTLFWHGHFATSAMEVKSARHMFNQNEFLRHNCAGSFHDLVLGISRDPAMLKYLDNNTNRKEHPNENYARELMELFTMGIGNYTEQDVKEAARAFTGWTFRPGTDDFVFADRQHDYGTKTFLGETGNFDGTEVVETILKQPATARFMAKKLLAYFVNDKLEPVVVEECAAAFRDGNYEVRPFLRKLFRSELFYSQRSYRTQIKSPAQLIVGSVRLLEVTIEERALEVAMRGLGQELLAPPNVKGWDGGEAWITTNTLLLRYNLARYLITGDLPGEEGKDKSPGEPRDRFKRVLRNAQPENKLAAIVPQEMSIDPAKTVDTLVARLLQTRLDERERASLVDQALSVLSHERPQVVAHLIMSMPAYQLC